MTFLEAEDSTENDFILKSSNLYINFINKHIISNNSLVQENLLINDNDNLESCNFTQIKSENVYSQAYEDLWNDYFKALSKYNQIDKSNDNFSENKILECKIKYEKFNDLICKFIANNDDKVEDYKYNFIISEDSVNEEKYSRREFKYWLLYNIKF
ncbi:uncharacterized protein CMU_032670 [Cryptosporidium muris RN66]|uniref:Uncharacterized protein n=1 Tax=Cryptosporidium muris (strain RN66) TaxID=441375 RepID=B6AF91_CRYMR|nr:uncharacterized protein CMU_032670 [Cryptosporidium muris RN66]EEA06882.1 hypothetical protein, conserved [Cryptosporidium muris RN66]|eukprot:XP_002141231.1 hypothetical protein [Cryptosporidium muris RN66]